MHCIKVRCWASLPLSFVHEPRERQPHLVDEVIEHDFSIVEVGKDRDAPASENCFRTWAVSMDSRPSRDSSMTMRHWKGETPFQRFQEALKPWSTVKLRSANSIILKIMFVGTVQPC